jgi:hypothetical protein
MKVNLALTGEDIDTKLNAVYTRDFATPGTLSAAGLRNGVIGVATPSRQLAVVSLNPLSGKALDTRDMLYLKTDVAMSALDPKEDVLGFVEKVIMDIPEGQEEGIACTPLDFNLCRLKGLYADLQRPEVVGRVGSYDEYKRIAADNIELLAKDSRDYVRKAVGNAITIQDGLGDAEKASLQAFNHLRRVMGSVFDLDIEDGEVYLDTKPNETRSLDDAETGGMNHIYAAISYAGSQRPFFLKYVPYYLLTAESAKFLHALSKPPQLAAVTSRPGPLVLPRKIEQDYGIAPGTKVTYHAVSRLGETNQRTKNAQKNAGPPMKFYYTYEDKGVTKVLTLERPQHSWVQRINRPPMEIPPGVVRNEAPVSATYKWSKMDSDTKGKQYIYDVKGSEHALTQAQHQKVLFHNASKMDLSDPNCPVHRTYEADASLDTVMNNMFNTLAARAAHNKNQIVELLPKGHRDRMALMKDVITVLRPDFEKEEQRIGAIRRDMFEKFAAGQIAKDPIEDVCRREARASLRSLIQAKRVSMTKDIGLQKLRETVGVIDAKFDKMYTDKAEAFTKMATGRALVGMKTAPFEALITANMNEHNGAVNMSQVLEQVSSEDRKVFDATALTIKEHMDAPGGFRDDLQAVYWGGVTQHLMDQFYGPEGAFAEGEYIGRKGLPRHSAEFIEYLGKNAPELIQDPVQVANRLSKTFAHFAYHVTPESSIPWPNLYRQNDYQRPTGRVNEARDKKTIKEPEPPVVLSMKIDVMNDGVAGTRPVRMTGKEPRKDVRQALPAPSGGRSFAGSMAEMA